jgi:hypothetical protein
VDIWSPGKEWQSAAPLSRPRIDLSAMALPDGSVLVVGGFDGQRLPQPILELERWDPTTARWQTVGTLLHGRDRPRLVLLDAGRVMIVGGATRCECESEIWDAKTGQVTSAGVMPSCEIPPANVRVNGKSQKAHRQGFCGGVAAVRLADGRVLVSGGSTNNVRSHARRETALWEPRQGTWSIGPLLGHARNGGQAVLLGTGAVLIVGGQLGGSGHVAEIYDAGQNRFTDVALPAHGFDQDATEQVALAMPSGDAVVIADEAARFDARRRTWTALATHPAGFTFEAVLLSDGRIFARHGGIGLIWDEKARLAGTWTKVPLAAAPKGEWIGGEGRPARRSPR